MFECQPCIVSARAVILVPMACPPPLELPSLRRSLLSETFRDRKARLVRC